MKAAVPIVKVCKRLNPKKRSTRDVDGQTYDGLKRLTVTKEVAKRKKIVGWVISKSNNWAIVQIPTASEGDLRLTFPSSSLEMNVLDAPD